MTNLFMNQSINLLCKATGFYVMGTFFVNELRKTKYSSLLETVIKYLDVFQKTPLYYGQGLTNSRLMFTWKHRIGVFLMFLGV